MHFIATLLTIALTSLSSTAAAVTPQTDVPPKAASVDPKTIAELVRPSLVVVEMWLKQDRGETPEGYLMGERGYRNAFSQFIDDERPIELPGYLIAPNLVVARDPEIPRRFIAAITVRSGDVHVDATPTAWLSEDGGMLLTLAGPIASAKPLSFLAADAKATMPLTTVHAQDWDGVWTLLVGGPQREVSDGFALEIVGSGAVAVATSEPDAVTVDANGATVRVDLTGRRLATPVLPANPALWPNVSAETMTRLASETRQRTDESILRATLHFRSPRKSAVARDLTTADGSDAATELEALAVVLDDGNVLVLANLQPSVTARLERVELIDSTDHSHSAEFLATLRDWGAFLAKPAESLSPGLTLNATDLSAWRNRLLMASSVRIVGRNRVSDPIHLRLGAFEAGWRGIRFPIGLPQESSAFLFAPDGSLAALPLNKREQPGATRNRFNRSGQNLSCTPASVLARALDSLDSSRDVTNIPLTEEEESRTGWLGALVQPLEPELARANGVAEFSRDGEFGGLVTLVYANSPAAKAGIEPGDVLLSITTPRRDRPIEIAFMEGDLGFTGVFPWDRLDELPEEYYDQIPAPWPPIEDSLNRTLTALGIGSRYLLEFAHDGTLTTKELTVELSPPHYGNAPKFEDTAMGMTVRDLTLEVRQYLNLTDDAPGVVVSKLEPGQRASVAGLRPFEIITEVDGQPVTSAAVFGTLVEGKKDLKFTVKRAQKERVVKVALAG